MSHDAAMHSWQTVLADVRAGFSTPVRDLRPAWRAQAYRAFAGQPEPIIRAEAFRRVLRQDAVYLYPGDRLCGSHRGWFAVELPADMDEDGYAALTAAAQARGQRDFWAGWDHSLADYPTLLAIGVGGYLARARASWAAHPTPAEQATLRGMIITLEAFAAYMGRWADAAAARGEMEMAAVARHVATEPPRTFHEAVQLIAFTHLVFESEGRYAMALGRIDQYLWPFYTRDLAAGRLTRAAALDLLCHLWVKLAENDGIQNICIGGLTPDGRDATNDLSYLCLTATEMVQSPATNLSARLHDDTPEDFLRACFRVIRSGVGFPAVFNDHVLIPGLMEIGIPAEVARDHCMVGCIETMLAGRQPAWSDGRFNMPLHLTQAMHRLRGRAGLTYDLLFETFLEEMRGGLAAYRTCFNSHLARFPAAQFPDPFLSALTRDCIDRARDINDGGAEWPRFHGIAMMGLGTTADALAAVRQVVFAEERVGYTALLDALDADFSGHEEVRQLLLRAPKYGNDDEAVDAIAASLVDWTSRECLRYPIEGGGRFVSAMAANVSNIPAGKEVGATPDGRHAYTPLSDAASPSFGCDRHGPTAFLRSVARPDYHRVLTGSVINMKFDPTHFSGDAGEQVFLALLHFFIRHRIQELQFNFTGDETLLAAQRHPEQFHNLVVRVSGFSAYFTALDREVQEDVIRRRAHPLIM